VNAGLLSQVEYGPSVSGGLSNVDYSTAVYTYYDGSESYGNVGDLMTATIEDGAGNPIGTDYYRYYTSADAGTTGYVGGLKYAFTQSAYAELKASGVDPFTAADSVVAPFCERLLSI